jgi:hypothetical protein
MPVLPSGKSTEIPFIDATKQRLRQSLSDDFETPFAKPGVLVRCSEQLTAGSSRASGILLTTYTCFSMTHFSVTTLHCAFSSDFRLKSTYSVDDTVIRLRPGRYGVRIPARVEYFFLIQSAQANSGAHLASYTMGTRDSALW